MTILSMSSIGVVTPHDIIALHTYSGGTALDVFGLSAPNTIARLTPSSNPGAAAAILATTAAGLLTLTTLHTPTINGGTAANDDVTIQGTTHSTRTTSYVNLQPNGGRVGIGTSAPVSNLTVAQGSSDKTGIWLTGTGVGGGSGTSISDGFIFVLNYNSAGNRQLYFGASDNFGLATRAMFRIISTSSIAGIDAVSGDGNTRLPVMFGTDTSSVAIGGATNKAYNIPLPGKLSVYAEAANKGVFIQGYTSQVGNLFECQDYTNWAVDYIAPSGIMTISPNIITAGINTLLTLSNLGSGANADGGAISFLGKSSTTMAQAMGLDQWLWVDATHASRKARRVFNVYDTAVREGLRIEASGAAPMVGFYGGSAVVRGAALTAQLTTITHTAPGTPDYAIQDFAQNGGAGIWGFADHDEANSVLKVIANLQTRVAELENRLSSAAGVNLFA